jgi:hypothetical protein
LSKVVASAIADTSTQTHTYPPDSLELTVSDRPRKGRC